MYVELAEQALTHLLIRSTTEKYAFGYDDARPATTGQVLHDMLQEEHLSGATLNSEVRLQLLSHLAAIRGIGQDDRVLIRLAHIISVHFKRVDQFEHWFMHVVQNEPHGTHEIGQRHHLSAKESLYVEAMQLLHTPGAFL